MLDLA